MGYTIGILQSRTDATNSTVRATSLPFPRSEFTDRQRSFCVALESGSCNRRKRDACIRDHTRVMLLLLRPGCCCTAVAVGLLLRLVMLEAGHKNLLPSRGRCSRSLALAVRLKTSEILLRGPKRASLVQDDPPRRLACWASSASGDLLQLVAYGGYPRR